MVKIFSGNLRINFLGIKITIIIPFNTMIQLKKLRNQIFELTGCLKQDRIILFTNQSSNFIEDRCSQKVMATQGKQMLPT